MQDPFEFLEPRFEIDDDSWFTLSTLQVTADLFFVNLFNFRQLCQGHCFLCHHSWCSCWCLDTNIQCHIHELSTRKKSKWCKRARNTSKAPQESFYYERLAICDGHWQSRPSTCHLYRCQMRSLTKHYSSVRSTPFKFHLRILDVDLCQSSTPHGCYKATYTDTLALHSVPCLILENSKLHLEASLLPPNHL